MSIMGPREVYFDLNDGRVFKTTEAKLRDPKNMDQIMELSREDLTEESMKRLREYIKLLLN